jgi:hypothetical protein
MSNEVNVLQNEQCGDWRSVCEVEVETFCEVINGEECICVRFVIYEIRFEHNSFILGVK